MHRQKRKAVDNYNYGGMTIKILRDTESINLMAVKGSRFPKDYVLELISC
jgi:hypothetical protein